MRYTIEKVSFFDTDEEVELPDNYELLDIKAVSTISGTVRYDVISLVPEGSE